MAIPDQSHTLHTLHDGLEIDTATAEQLRPLLKWERQENGRLRRTQHLAHPELVAANCTLQEVVDDLKRALKKQAVAQQEREQWMGNLLAVIHRDGGHYIDRHGLQKACKDGEKIVLALREEKEAVVLAEREACAQVALGVQISETSLSAEWGRQCAAAIRRRPDDE